MPAWGWGWRSHGEAGGMDFKEALGNSRGAMDLFIILTSLHVHLYVKMYPVVHIKPTVYCMSIISKIVKTPTV